MRRLRSSILPIAARSALALVVAAVLSAGGALPANASGADLPGSGATVMPAESGSRSISGTVSLGSTGIEAGAGAVTVSAWHGETSNSLPATTTTTDAQGHYSLTGLVAGAHRLEFTPADGSFASAWWTPGPVGVQRYAGSWQNATSIDLGTAATGHADIVLLPGGRISGTVRRGDGSTIANWVTLSRSLGVQPGDNDYTEIIETRELTTDASGTYSFSGLLPGVYRVDFQDTSGNFAYARSWAGSTADDPLAKGEYTIAAGDVVTADAVQFLAGSVSGDITCPACTDLWSGGVTVKRFNTTTQRWQDVKEDFAASGYFVVSGLVPGHYRVSATATNTPESWRGISEFDLPEGGSAIVISQLRAPTVDRIDGVDRFAVSAKVAARFEAGVPVVYLANGVTFPDALSAGPAAAAQGGPLLLTLPDRIPDAVGAQIMRLAPERIVVVGGPVSVTPAVLDELARIAPDADVERVSGPDRFSTSRAIADYAFGTSGALDAYLATGTKFPDALSASGAAAKNASPVIVVNGGVGDLDGDTAALLDELGAKSVHVVGGPASVSTGIVDDLRSMFGTNAVKWVTGDDRWAVSSSINRDGFDVSETAIIAVGTNFPDALSGGALAGALGASLFVVPTECIPRGVMVAFSDLDVTDVILLGGTKSLSPAVAQLTVCPW